MLRFDNNTDSNHLSEAHFYWTVLTAIVSKMFVLTIFKKIMIHIYIGHYSHCVPIRFLKTQLY